MVGRTAAGLARGLASLAAVAVCSASPALAAAHRIILPPEINKVWVAPEGGVGECKSYRTDRDMVGCKRFRAISPSGQVDWAGDLVYIVRMSNSEFRRGTYTVDRKHNGGPIKLPIPPADDSRG